MKTKTVAKKTTSVFLCFLLLFPFALLAGAAGSPTIIAEGSYGADNRSDNVRWSLDSDGLLTISGEGDMYADSSINAGDWVEQGYAGQIKKARIMPGVTSIGFCAFRVCSRMESIEIADTVTTIYPFAFDFCTSLSSINIPDSVTSIGGYAFQSCTSLTHVRLPDHLTFMAVCLFNANTKLTSITIPKSVTVIQTLTISNCPKLKDIYYTGSEEEWNQIEIWEDNQELLSATIHFNSEGPQQSSLQQILQKVKDWFRNLFDKILAIFR